MMGRPKVVITARSFGRYSREAFAILERAGCEISHLAGTRAKSAEEMISLVRDTDGLIVGCDEVSAAVLDAAPCLRIIAKFGVGYDNIDVKAARERGVHVTYTPGATEDAVAELAMGLIVALARQILPADAAVRASGWQRPASVGLWHKTLGIVGLGAVGKKLALRACAFEMRILAYDVAPDSAFARQHGIQYVSLEHLLQESDFVSLHVPLMPQTTKIIGQLQLQLMKPTAYLVNTARGELVDEDALIRALREGVIVGAALDVFWDEPPLDSPLLTLSSVILTPHMAGDTPAACESKGAMSATDVVRVVQGQHPLHPVP
jgi:D-3-phosphoglycerate dehydrogenase